MQAVITHCDNIGEMIRRRAVESPDRPAVAGDFGTLAYRELYREVMCVARRLQEAGCVAGDRVVVAVSDPVTCIACLFGTVTIGAIAVPVNPLQFAQDPQPFIARVAPSMTIRDDGFSSLTIEANPISERTVDAAVIVHTSGSTGTQKAVAHSHRSVWSAGETITSAFNIHEQDRMLCLPRPYYAYGLGFGTFFPAFAGACTIVGSSALSIPEIARLMSTHHPTIIAAVPSTLAAILKSSVHFDWSSVRFVISAGEILPVQIYEAFRNRFGIEVLDGLGSTEMLTHFTSNLPGKSRRGSCGVPLPGYELLLQDDEGRNVPNGVIGSLTVKGRSSLMGYWRGSGLDYVLPPTEPLRTGDQFYRDDDGYYYFSGRDDDMIKVAGAWVSPNEVQSILAAHPDVEKAFVTAHTGPDLGRLIAYVVAARGTCPTKGAILKHLAHLPTHMIPSSIIFLEELPLTSNGKVNRMALPPPDRLRPFETNDAVGQNKPGEPFDSRCHP